ncbi:MAG: GtrA family protein [Candidatus Margulisbacteria bacterium]|nr:GtrA family protein [Candidatus Margulisiibacteriota bacterium]
MPKIINILKLEQVKFILVGILNTIFSYIIYSFFILLHFNFAFAATASYLLGILFNFKTYGSLVFKNSDNKLIFKFVFSYLIIYSLYVGIIKIFLVFGFNELISGAISTIITALMSYFTNKYYVFKTN